MGSISVLIYLRESGMEVYTVTIMERSWVWGGDRFQILHLHFIGGVIWSIY